MMVSFTPASYMRAGEMRKFDSRISAFIEFADEDSGTRRRKIESNRTTQRVRYVR
jgi:hypothetical protein